MNRSIAISNKTTYTRVTNKNYTLHLERLQKIKNKSSQTLQLQNHNSNLLKSASQLHLNNKKKELETELNNIKIDRENKLLLDKMTKIVNNRTYRPGIVQKDSSSTVIKSEPRAKSLNEHVRKQEIEKIMVENQGIIQRLQQQTSFYNVNRWEKDHRMRETYLKNMAGFSIREGFINSATERAMRKTCVIKTVESPVRRASLDKRTKNSFSIKTSVTSIPSVHHSRADSTVKKFTLYKKEAEIEGTRYFVEFTMLEKNLQVALYRIDNPEVKYITLEDQKARRLLVENDNDYEKIIGKIGFVDNEPVIKGFELNKEAEDEKKIELFNSFKNKGNELPTQKTEKTEPHV